MKSGKFISGLLLGAATGAVLGALFAPAKGSKIRKGIRKKGKKLAKKNFNGVPAALNRKVAAVGGHIKKSGTASH